MLRAGPHLHRLLLGLALPAVASTANAQPSTSTPPPDSAAGARPEAARSPLVTDRPDFTESTASVAAGRVQVESGYTLSRTAGSEEHALGEVLVRVGVARRVELRVVPDSYLLVEGPDGTVEGLADPSLGAKATLVEPGPDAAGPVPAVALLTSVSLPAGDDALNPDGAQPSAALALGWDVGDRLSVGANVKHTRRLSEGERFGRTTASAALGVSATGRLGAYLEYYTLRPTAPASGDADVVDGGITFLLGPDAQLDARVGVGLGPPAADLIFGLGLSVRR